MTYDHWKTDPGDIEDPTESRVAPEGDELQLVYERLFRLRASHATLIAAAKEALTGTGRGRDSLRAAIAAAEEIEP